MPKKPYWYLIIGLAITLSALLFSISYQVSAATPHRALAMSVKHLLRGKQSPTPSFSGWMAAPTVNRNQQGIT